MTKKQMIRQYVQTKIHILLKQKDSGTGKAALANLRHGVGKKPGELPELWGAFLEDAPSGLYGERKGASEPQKEEWAVYTALTLFAVHQQGKPYSVNTDNANLGEAAAKLMKDRGDEERERVLRRFSPVVTATSMAELSHYLRTFIQLIKDKDIALNYAELAEDIYDFQFENSKNSVQLKWGRGFYKKINSDEEKGE